MCEDLVLNCSCVPIIVILCYLVGEICKVLFKRVIGANKLIPLVTIVIGGILGILIYLTNPEIIFNTDNIWQALGIGIVSGASSTSASKIIKKIIKKDEEKENAN